MLKYWLWLATRKGLGPRGAYLIARHFASPEEAYYAAPERYEEVEGLRSFQPLLDKELRQPEQILRSCYEKGISILTIQDAAYPQRLRATDDPPVVLYYRGTLPDLNGPVIGVVGTRKASAYGMSQASRMGYGLSRCGCVVVSGGARGVDTGATRGALTGGSPVVLVLGCGVDVVYPAENRSLFRDVEANGCLLSEYPPGTEPRSVHFPVRNRIISGLSLGVLVVEAPEKSGALITASRALDQGRDVFTLPANLGVESCSGNLRLLRDGAILVRDAWDLLEEYALQYPGILSKQDWGCEKTADIPPEKQAGQEPEEKKVIDKPETKSYIDLKDIMGTLSRDEQCLAALLQEGPKHIDAIVDETQMTSGRALASLTLLEVKGIVRRPSPRMYALAPAGK